MTDLGRTDLDRTDLDRTDLARTDLARTDLARSALDFADQKGHSVRGTPEVAICACWLRPLKSGHT